MAASSARLRLSLHRVTSRSGPGNADFYPLSTLSGRTGALIRGFCPQQKSPASEYSCLDAVVWLWRRELNSRLLLLCLLLDRISHQSQGCSATSIQSLGGRDPVCCLGFPGHDRGQVLTPCVFFVVCYGLQELTCSSPANIEWHPHRMRSPRPSLASPLNRNAPQPATTRMKMCIYLACLPR